jgi:hypothetical protein
LRKICVLILVNQNDLEPVPQIRAQRGVAFDKSSRADDQPVEIKLSTLVQFL